MNLNKAQIIGRVTQDPEIRQTSTGRYVATINMATNRSWKSENGEKNEAVDYHRVVLLGRLAEIAQKYVTKGKLIYIEGRIQTRNWEKDDGTKKYVTEIIAQSLQLGPGGEKKEIKEEPEEYDIPA